MAAWRISVFLVARFDEEFKHLRTELAGEMGRRNMHAVNLKDDRSDTRAPDGRSFDALDGCEAMVLLLGPTYGESDAEGLSLTHREFRRAVRDIKPIFAYTTDGIDPNSPAGRFAEEVKRSGKTCGKFEDRARLDALRIVCDIKDWQLEVGDVDLPDVKALGLGAQAADLGFLN